MHDGSLVIFELWKPVSYYETEMQAVNWSTGGKLATFKAGFFDYLSDYYSLTELWEAKGDDNANVRLYVSVN